MAPSAASSFAVWGFKGLHLQPRSFRAINTIPTTFVLCPIALCLTILCLTVVFILCQGGGNTKSKMNNRTTQPGGNRATPVTTPSQTLESPTKDYQDEDETRDSKLKAVWDNELGDLKSKHIPYQKAYVLLLSWHKDIDDLKTDEEVSC